MTGEEIRRTINDIVEVLVESGRNMEVVFEDYDSQVVLNRRKRNAIKIYSYVEEEETCNEEANE